MGDDDLMGMLADEGAMNAINKATENRRLINQDLKNLATSASGGPPEDPRISSIKRGYNWVKGLVK